MAVTFKVPKSPSRDIFVIDNFLGVDLTNTGSNIDENRSPNAENMVRYVPGKVRKRTGYEKEILFGRDVNVNYAIGTSSEEKEMIVLDEDINTPITLYNLIQKIASKDGNSYTIYLDFDYFSEEDFTILSDETIAASPEEFTHASLTKSYNSSSVITEVDIESAVAQHIVIKNFSIMRGRDSDYKWSPAPKYFVERPNDDPVFGCHIMKHGTFEGNRVKNVNRALSTSSSFTTTTATNSWQNIYLLGEVPYPGTKIYIEFDYKLSGDPLHIAFAGGSFTIQPTSDIVHISTAMTTNTYNNKAVSIKSSGTSSTLDIRSLSVMYEKDEDYDWSRAPEDSGLEFPMEDIYFTGSENYAVIDSYDNSDIASGGTLYRAATVCDASSHVDGFCHVSFDIHTATYKQLVQVQLFLVDDGGASMWSETFTSNLNSKHFDLYVTAGASNEYFKSIGVSYTTDGGGTCWTYISNIKVNSIKPKTSYDISPKQYIYHVGGDFYLRASNSSDFVKVYDNANKHLSKSWQFDQKLYLLDGKNIYSYTYGDETVVPIDEETGYIPTLTIAKSPTGGGTPYEPLNMLQPGFIEMFQGTDQMPIYYLSFGNLDSTTIKAWVLDQYGNWVEKIEGTDFIVNRGVGYVDFFSSPGVSPLTGEDNVKILAYRTVPGYRERVTKCTIGALFGVGGAEDRLFLSGNPDHPNWDFYSEQYDPTYFPDTGYSALGSESSSIVGYALVNNYLATFKDGGDLIQAVFIREGDLIKNNDTGVSEPAFKLINTLQGHGVVAPYAFGNLQTEPVFLTKAGIFAITAQDITGEKYSQNRSFYLNGKLTKEDNMEDAVATVYNDMYVLAPNNQLYILDGLQATRTDRSEPYATRQYVGFHCTDVPANCVWNDDALFFGSSDGKICKFYTDVESLDSYNDDGQPIYCCWETPDLDGKLFYKNKTFRYFAIRMMSALKTSAQMWSQRLGEWTFIKETAAISKIFDFNDIDFTLFSFRSDNSEKVAHAKIRVKKVDKAKFRVENGHLNEPFGLFDLALEYVESGNYKR